MTEPKLNILEQLEGEWRELLGGIRQEKMEELFMQATAMATRASAVAGAGELTSEERAQALTLHDETEKLFLASFEGLNEAQWTFRPAPDRWTVQEVTEHVVLVESVLMGIVKQVMAGDPDPNFAEPPDAWEVFKLRALDRSVRGFNPPPPVIPQGRWTIEETRRRFLEGRAATREVIATPGLPLKNYGYSGGPGAFNCYHWTLMMSLHARRHLGQITELKLTTASAGFPQ